LQEHSRRSERKADRKKISGPTHHAPTQREKILEALQLREHTNVELSKIGGLRFGGRIHELRQPEHGGHTITVRSGKTEGEFIYTLQPPELLPLFAGAGVRS
jgi:hypothetical protein